MQQCTKTTSTYVYSYKYCNCFSHSKLAIWSLSVLSLLSVIVST